MIIFILLFILLILIVLNIVNSVKLCNCIKKGGNINCKNLFANSSANSSVALYNGAPTLANTGEKKYQQIEIINTNNSKKISVPHISINATILSIYKEKRITIYRTMYDTISNRDCANFDIIKNTNSSKKLFLYNHSFANYISGGNESEGGNAFLNNYRRDVDIKEPQTKIFALGIPTGNHDYQWRRDLLKYQKDDTDFLLKVVENSIDNICTYILDHKNIEEIYYSSISIKDMDMEQLAKLKIYLQKIEDYGNIISLFAKLDSKNDIEKIRSRLSPNIQNYTNEELKKYKEKIEPTVEEAKNGIRNELNIFAPQMPTKLGLGVFAEYEWTKKNIDAISNLLSEMFNALSEIYTIEYKVLLV